MLLICYHGEERSFDFKVSNTESDLVNEVLLNYTLSINLNTIVPVKVTLYDITSGSEQEVKLSDNKTENLSMSYGTQEIRTYRLKLNWSNTDNDVKYAGQQILCTIQLDGEQVIN